MPVSLPDLIAAAAGAGTVVGAFVGLVLPSAEPLAFMRTTLDGAQYGAIAGSAVAYSIWLGVLAERIASG